MLGYFPRFYDDELLYSTISRYHMVSGNQNYKITLEEIFNCNKQVPILEFVSNLSELINKLPENFEIESKNIIQKHTMFPLYSPFLPEARKLSIIKTMLYDDGRGLKPKIGMIAGSICRKSDLMYCPLCSEEEYEKHGESYFHRLHQAQGVLICPIHRCLLKKYPLIRNNQSRIKYIKFDNSILDKTVEYATHSNDMFIKIAENVKYILNNDLNNYNQEKIHKKYMELLRKNGFLSVNNRIKQREVYEKFTFYFGEDLLNTLQSNVDYNNEYNWLKVLLRNSKRVVHPLRQILFIMFISENMKQFFSDDIHEDNIQRYPCLNHFCENYNKLNINDYKITADYKTRDPIITIKCTCGFIYSRRVCKDIYTVGRIKEYGKLWEENLYDLLVEKKYHLRSLARMMKCDPKTIIRYADKLGLRKFVNTNMNIKYKENSESHNTVVDSKEYKENIINYIRKNNNISRENIKTHLYRQYMWLYKNDKCWLEENLPTKKKRCLAAGYSRVDWNKRDEEILILLKQEYKNITMTEKRPRITKSFISRRIGKSAILEKHLNKLPKCEKYINEVIETVEQYQIYRINNVAKNMIDEGEEAKRWKLVKRSGLRPGVTEKVSKEIEINIKKVQAFIQLNK